MSNEARKEFMNGDEAIAYGAKLTKPGVIPAYPITPQTIAVEKISEFVANGEMDCEYMHVESEHSAMCAAMGASLAGARTFTATSSQGLLYMCEMLHYVSGSRFPVVMMNANRTVAAPWNIFGDQRDSISQRDSGWIQVYVENAQEALDMIIQAYKVAENEKVYTPMMVNMDGFVNTHTYELVDIPAQADVDEFLPPFKSLNAVDFNNPKSFCMSAATDWNMEFRYQQEKAIQDAIPVIESVDKEFGDKFGRYYGGLVSEYKCEDAEAVLVCLGSTSGTARIVVDELRAQGKKVGAIKLRYYRPFPREFFKGLGDNIKAVGVLDRDISFGYEGAVASDVKAALYEKEGSIPNVINFIAGIAGRDIRKESLEGMFDKLIAAAGGEKQETVQYVDLRWPV
jgi:pyruvate ferredoxin oxidoreductase alpha subunit